MWTPTLLQQFWGPGPGNLSDAITGSSAQGDPIGWAAGRGCSRQRFRGHCGGFPGGFSPQVTSLDDLGEPGSDCSSCSSRSC